MKKPWSRDSLKKSLKYLVFAVVCSAAILPSLTMGYFQTLHFTEEKFELFEQHLETIARNAEKGSLTPSAALDVLHVHELVLWCRYLRSGEVLGQSGVFSNMSSKRSMIQKTIHMDQPFKGQIPVPRISFEDENEIYVLSIPLQNAGTDVLEVGIWFEPLASLKKNGLALSLVLFLTAMIFLLGVYIFIDNYLVTIFEKVAKGLQPKEAKALKSLEKTEAPFFSPSIRNLLSALKEHSTVLDDERTARTTMETFIAELNRQLAEQKLKLEETHNQLMQTSKMAAVGELAGGVAHEVNNPNGLILAGAKYLQGKIKNEDPPLPAYIEVYLDRIVRQSNRISEIVSALLTFSRRRPTEKEPLSIKDCVQDAHELAVHRFKNIQFEERLSHSDQLVLGNRNQLTQVFLNLFNNAVDAMPEGGRLEVWDELQEKAGGPPELWISVHNSGANIPAELLNKVMEPFFTTKGLGKGTGLGLSVSLGIVQDHKGKMQVANHASGGAIFCVQLPTLES